MFVVVVKGVYYKYDVMGSSSYDVRSSRISNLGLTEVKDLMEDNSLSLSDLEKFVKNSIKTNTIDEPLKVEFPKAKCFVVIHKMKSSEVKRIQKAYCDCVLIVEGKHYMCGFTFEVSYRRKLQNIVRKKIKSEMPFYGEYEITYKGKEYEFTCKRMSKEDVKCFELGI